MNKDFYYGQPQVLWDVLCAEAEDLLQEEQLGTHLVAIYPAGNRIYGLESYPPGIFCLYVDSVEVLIDPISDYHKQSGFNVFSVGNGGSPIIMVDIFKWVQWLTSRCYDWRAKAFLHAIPFGQHVIHEDHSIIGIMEACHNAMKDINYGFHSIAHTNNTRFKSFEYLEPHPFLRHRATTILHHTGKFIPNINPNWDTVIEGPALGILLDETLEKHDKITREQILNNNNIFKLGIGTNIFEPGRSYPYTIAQIKADTLKNIRQTVMDFYRFQL